MSKEDSRGGWSEDPFQNIQPREEHSPGGSHVTVTTIKSTIKRENTEERVHHKVQKKARLDFSTKHLKKAWTLLEKHSLESWN